MIIEAAVTPMKLAAIVPTPSSNVLTAGRP